ncbi:MAG: 3-deoxy-D-manno-octulosonic acid transferase [Gemmobacter sp.]
MTRTERRPSPALRIALILWRLALGLGLPLLLAYLWHRGRRDPRYRLHWNERFGGGPVLRDAVWVHAVSLGEMRSALPLVRALLDSGHRVVTTHLTPAGRDAAKDALAPEIAAGRALVRYLPVDLAFAWRRILPRARPRLVIVLEIEIWPTMIAECARAGVPLVLANSQIPARSWPRARRLARWVGHPASLVAGVLAKSERHAARFREIGAPNVQAAGELRFDQPIPARLTEPAPGFRAALGGRGVVTLASVIAGEEPVFLDAIRKVQASVEPAPLFVWVPRAPELFDATAAMLSGAGQQVVRRSRALDEALHAAGGLGEADILLGDSFGEMYFYLAVADLAVVGGGFVPKGAHNVIEPLALRKPVLVGPHVWTIEYPGEEARAAGVLEICADAEVLATRIAALVADPEARAALAERASRFFADHSGAAARSLRLLSPWLEDRR